MPSTRPGANPASAMLKPQLNWPFWVNNPNTRAKAHPVPGDTTYPMTLDAALNFTGQYNQVTTFILVVAVLSFTGAITKQAQKKLNPALSFAGTILEPTITIVLSAILS